MSLLRRAIMRARLFGAVERAPHPAPALVEHVGVAQMCSYTFALPASGTKPPDRDHLAPGTARSLAALRLGLPPLGAWPRSCAASVRPISPRTRSRSHRQKPGAPSSPVAPLLWAGTSSAATGAGRRATSITPAVIGTVRCARPGRRRRGSQRAGARCCRCPTFTWCSPCPMP